MASLFLTLCAEEHGAHGLYPGIDVTSVDATSGLFSVGVHAEDSTPRETLVHSPGGVDALPRAGNDPGPFLLALVLFALWLPLSDDRVDGDYRQPVRRKRAPPLRAGHGRAFLHVLCVART
ncbi:hypothetical protein AOZ06_29800 [Kibdelosporangium phytohabitans]|uniref:Uncharacterized protein n=1 Tax=Kibdelosporangium phytohabitans TaxID=860235 RepID=A0A0N9I3N0_9PSEU|nr:hypothetical protein AOZ06_29800 [Kibdelosporangium phytohabitans]